MDNKPNKANIDFKPFANESTCIQINGLTIENRLDKVSVYGSIEFTKDQAGLALARKLKGIIDVVAAQLETEDHGGRLPEAIQIEKSVVVGNPLGGKRGGRN